MFKKIVIASALLLAACSTTSEIISPEVETGQTPYAITSHLGIDYATAKRWELPEVNSAWTERGDFGPACPQRGQTIMTEDCLFLNVFAPVTTETRLPVLIWIHGGGFIAGQGGDGPKPLARDGVVVVTFNYRLGKLGFHDWAGWDEDDPRNFGQADMAAALDWVQANIEGFGGDPDNVTLAGHSAGGMGVQLMMVDPRAKGKFARAWSHAGYGSWPLPEAYNPSPAERARIRYAALETDRSPDALVADVTAFHLPFIDAPYLKAAPFAAFISGKAASVPYVAGANSYDGAGTLQGAGFTPEGFLSEVDSPELRLAYAEDFAVSNTQAVQRIFGDLRYFLSSIETADAADGWLFYYDERREGEVGAGHGQQYDRLFDSDDFAMRQALLAFIQSGEPGWDKLSRGRFAKFSPELSLAEKSQLERRRIILRETVERLRP